MRIPVSTSNWIRRKPSRKKPTALLTRYRECQIFSMYTLDKRSVLTHSKFLGSVGNIELIYNKADLRHVPSRNIAEVNMNDANLRTVGSKYITDELLS